MLPSTIPKPLPYRQYLNARERKSQRAIYVFPVGRILPTCNAPCTRYRLKRKDKRNYEALERTLEELKARLGAAEAQYQEQLEMKQRLDLLSAQVNSLCVTVSKWVQQPPQCEEPILEVCSPPPSPQAHKPSLLPNFHIHQRHIPPDSNTYPLLEVVHGPHLLAQIIPPRRQRARLPTSIHQRD